MIADFCISYGKIKAFRLDQHACKSDIDYLSIGKDKDLAHRITHFSDATNWLGGMLAGRAGRVAIKI
ncbi:hypothetical protein [Aurantivibrio infirmus]